MNTKRLLFGLLLFFVQITGYAQDGELTHVTTPSITGASAVTGSKFPENCGSAGVAFQPNGQLILDTGSSPLNPQLYLIHNNSDFQQILISHPNTSGMAAGWQSRLDHGQWSALAINHPGFVINCFGRKPGAIGYVDCRSVIDVCSFSQANVSGGSYWIAENKSLLDTLNSLHHQKVIGSKYNPVTTP